MTTLAADLPLDDALTAMRRAATHLAAVADASGRVLGLVALEDVLEMLVGEVRDPAHTAAEEPEKPGRSPGGSRGAGSGGAGDGLADPARAVAQP
jgi:CBS domain containing-hemolysin-like protein